MKGLFALTPLMVFLALYAGLGIITGDIYATPITVVFLIATLYSLCVLPRRTWAERFQVLNSGLKQDGLMQMIWIFLLAGAFAAIAKQMGAINATVELVTYILPSNLILPALFISACIISVSIGTSVGTIAALTPIATGIAQHAHVSLPMMVAIVVGGSFFGDNLSFISDTTIVATRTQGCRQSDKFRENVRIALPAALLTMIWYVVCGLHLPAYVSTGACDLVAILPYLFVFTAAMFGMDVMLVLVLGIIMASAIGLTTHALGVASLMKAMNDGMMGMSELIIVTLMASSMMAVIREAGGIDYILSHVVCHIKSARAAQLTMAALTVLTNICTANNTIAILTIGTVAREIARERGVSPRRAASVLDTFSCFTQGLLPYGAQLLIASGLAAVSPVEIIPYLYYPFILGICAFGYCLLQGRDLRNIVHKKTTKNKR